MKPACQNATMKLTSHLPDDRRVHVEGRLRANQIAWLTTVRAGGRPDSVPVWYLLRDDETILIYSQPAKIKLGNISRNPAVALGLDVTDLGRDIIRIDGTAVHAPGFPAAGCTPEIAHQAPERAWRGGFISSLVLGTASGDRPAGAVMATSGAYSRDPPCGPSTTIFRASDRRWPYGCQLA
jgi:PPOX class probable F420-dependent enzyme